MSEQVTVTEIQLAALVEALAGPEGATVVYTFGGGAKFVKDKDDHAVTED